MSASADSVTHLGNDVYSVQSAKDPSRQYEVQSTTGVCTCYSGQQGAFCKHQAAVHIKFGLLFPNCPSLTADDKQQLYYVATGSNNMHSSFFAPFTSQCSIAASDEYDEGSTEPSAGVEAGAENMDVETTENASSAVSTPVCEASDGDSIRQRLRQQFERLSQMLDDSKSDNGLMKAADKMAKQLESIKTPQQLLVYLTAQSNVCSRRQRKIRVQPTAIARRRAGCTSGSSRHRSGRPLQQNGRARAIACKRLRSLASAVRRNQPNAKSHGQGH